MICPKCKQTVSVLEDTCPHCKIDLTKPHIERRYTESSQTSWAKELQNKWKGDTPSKPFNIKKPLEENSDSSWINSYRKKWSDTKTEFDTNSNKIESDALHELLMNKRQRMSMIQELTALVFSNPHVTRNGAYHNKSSITDCRYFSEEMRVNASAGVDKDKKAPVILLYDGYINFILAIEAIFINEKYDQLSMLGNKLKSNDYVFSSENVIDVLEKMPDQKVNFEHAFMSFFETIAHELGHICLDHVLSPGYGSVPLDISRNQEREADSFASSLVASSIFKEHLFESHMRCCVAWAIIEKVGGRVEPTTHPLSLERLRNAIRNNYELAKNMGLDEKWVEKVFH